MGTIVAIIAAFSFAPMPLDLSPFQQNVMIRGTVADGSTRQPVSGALVYARSDAFVQTTVSDAKGNFYFLTLWPGDYKLSASKSGFGDCPAVQEAQELDAGFEYLAQIWVDKECI